MIDAAKFAAERLSYAEVAAIVGVPEQSVRRWVMSEMHGFPRGFKIGHRRFFMRSEIEQWIETRRNAV